MDTVGGIAGILIIGALIIGALWLMVQRWFWLVAVGLCLLASVFTVIASVIHFQILGAVGFTLLSIGLWLLWGWIYSF